MGVRMNARIAVGRVFDREEHKTMTVKPVNSNQSEAIMNCLFTGHVEYRSM